VNAGLGPYPAYKDSGVEWLGEIPRDWKTLAARRFCKIFAGATPNRDEPSYWDGGTVPWLSSGDVNHHRISSANQFITAAGFKASSTKWIRPGSLVIALAGQGKTKGMVALVTIAATCNQSLGVLEPSRSICDPEFLLFYFESRYRDIRGLVGDSRDGLNLEHLKQLPVPIPSMPEQVLIRFFLTHIDFKIQRLLALKEHMVGLLEEEKQATIHRAVSCGLESAPLSPTGITSFGELPRHWKLGQLRRFCSVVDCKHLTVPATDQGCPVVSVREVQGFDVDLSSARTVGSEAYRSLIEGNRKPARGDIVFCRNVSVGASAYVGTDTPFALGQDVCLIRPRHENGRFINYVMHGSGMRQQLSERLIGSTFNRVNISEIKSLLLPIPPRAEQDKIVDRLDSDLQSLNGKVTVTTRQLHLLREYRTRLISDVVTGKLDVREVARNLSEDPDAGDPALDEQLEQAASA